MRYRGVSVLHCHGVLVWRRVVFSTGGSTTGKGWQNWQKAIFNRVAEGLFWCDFVACPSFTAMVFFWCGGGLFSAPEAIQREKVGKIGKRLFLILAKGLFLFYWQKTIFYFIGKRLSFTVRPGLSRAVFDGLERYIDRFRNAQHDKNASSKQNDQYLTDNISTSAKLWSYILETTLDERVLNWCLKWMNILLAANAMSQS